MILLVNEQNYITEAGTPLTDSVDTNESGEHSKHRIDNRRMENRSDLPVRKIPEYHTVFRERESGQEAFIIQSGTIEIFKTVMEGGISHEITLATIGPGSMLGEMALIDDQPRMATARAVGGPLAVNSVTKDQFETMLDKTNPFVNKLVIILTSHTRSNGDQIKV